MTGETWLAAGIGVVVLVGLLAAVVMMLAPNRSLPPPAHYAIGTASRNGLAGEIVAGI